MKNASEIILITDHTTQQHHYLYVLLSEDKLLQ